MMVKNEEKTLERILSVAKKFCDEIIVVDTGSEDASVKIAEKYCDKVVFYPFENDFSKVRNYCFSLAKCDYLLWLDADDFIDDINVEKIQKLKITGLYADIYMFLYNTYDKTSGKLLLSYYRERLLKRDKNYKFSGAVHEAVELIGNVAYTDVVVEHRKEKKPSGKRNLNIYLSLLKKGHEFRPRELYYFARELYYNGYYKRAISYFNKFLRSEGTLFDRAEALLISCDCYLKLDDLKKAESAIYRALTEFTPYPEMLCTAGRVEYEKRNYEKSAFFYKSAMIPCKKNDGFHRPEYEDIIPLLWLTVIYYNLNDYVTAKKYHLACKKIAPDHPSVVYNDKLPIFKEVP